MTAATPALHERLHDRVSAFMGWWVDELTAMLPPSLRALVRPERTRLVIDVDGEEAVLTLIGARLHRSLGRVPLSDAPPAQRRIDALLGQARQRVEDVVLRLPATAVFHKVVTLPLAAQENLREVLAFEMDRLTPFRADWVYYDFEPRTRDPQAGQLTAALTVIPRKRLDALLDRLAALGLEATAVDVADPHAAAGTPRGLGINLLPDASQDRRWRLAHLWNGLLIATLVLLALAAVAIPVAQRHQLAADLRQELDAVAADAREARALQEALEQTTAAGSFLAQKKQAHHAVIEVLDELTRLVPDDAWVYRLELSPQRVTLAGEAAESAQLISLMESSPYFRGTRFDAPVTTNPVSGNERFTLSSNLIGRVGQ